MKQTSTIDRAAGTRAFRLLFTLALICALSELLPAFAQKSATAPANVAAGSPAGSYPLSGFDSVNLYSGNLNFSLPLAQVGGRGEVHIPLALAVNNANRWDLSRPNTVFNTNINVQGSFSYTYDIAWIDGAVPLPSTMNSLFWDAHSEWNAYNFYFNAGLLVPPSEPQPGDRPYHIEASFLHSDEPPYVLQQPKVGYNPGLLLYRTAYQGGRLTNDPNETVWGRSLTRLSFTASDGTEFELRDIKTGGEAHDARTNNNQVYSRGRVFVTVDGSFVTFVSDTEVTEKFLFQLDNIRPDRPSGFMLLPDGTRYRIDSGNVSWVRDRNGNVTTFAYDAGGRVVSSRDPIGRVVTIAYKGTTDPATQTVYDHDEIGFQGAGGTWHSIKVWRGHLADALTGGTTKIIRELFPAWELDDTGDELVNPDNVVSAVELPDGRRYELRYNAYGELARVVLPTGGKIEYEYLSIGSPLFVQRRVAERRSFVNASDTTPELRQVFTYSINNGSIIHQDSPTVDVEQRSGASGRLLSFEKHYFHNPLTTLHRGFYNSWRTGKEFKTETFDIAPDGTTPAGLLRRVEYKWQPRRYASFYSSSNPDNGPGYDPRIVETVTTLENGLTSRRTASDPHSPDPLNPVLGFDRFNNLTDQWEYDFHLPGEPEHLLRHTQALYVGSDAYTGGTWDIGSTPGAEAIQALLASPHLRSLPARKSVYDAGDKERARITREYDNYTPDGGGNNRHAALLPYSDIIGLCLTLDAAGNCVRAAAAEYTTRGNVTGVTAYLLDEGGTVTGSVTSNSRYDIVGNVVKAIDARVLPGGGGYETSIDFSDNFGSPDAEAQANASPSELSTQSLKSYALPRSITNALGHTAYTQYDYYTSQIVNTEDVNGTVTKLVYGQNDLLDRLTQLEMAVNYPDRPDLYSRTTYAYDDANHIITTTGDLRAYGDNLLKYQVLYDGLGRTTEVRKYETPSQYVATLTKYDALGRSAEVSNPFRPNSESSVWTASEYDALGRVTAVTTKADMARAYTIYSGNQTLVTDQAGNRRISRADALGRLTEVWEVTPNDQGKYPGAEAVSFPVPQGVVAPVAGFKTSYGYDVLGNLRKVEQGAQRRYFAYDSLGRLLRASNPEQEANESFSLPTSLLNWPADAHNAWSQAYEYDEVGNLKKRVDARGVEASYAYDALGRLTDRGYTDVPLPQGGTIKTPSVKYYYDSQELPPGAPGFERGRSKGRLVAVTYGGGASATGSYTGNYDELGRARYSAQVTALPDAAGQLIAQAPYVFGYVYNLDGSLKRETYPSGRIVESEYDAAGRLAGVKKQGGGYYAGGDPAVANNPNVISYTAHGAIAALRLGNGLWEHTGFNNRLQVEEIGLGTSHTDSSVLRLAYGYGVPTPSGTPDPTKNNGNVQSQGISVPAEGQTPAQTFTQVYAYDALNRLETAAESNVSGPTWAQVYTYDRYGNRRFDSAQTTSPKLTGQNQTALPAVANPSVQSLTNRMTEDQDGNGQKVYTYDAAGNLTCDAQHCAPSPAPTPFYDYDGESKLARAGGGTSAGGSEYLYDGGGLRVKKVAGAVTTVFVYDAAGRLAAEYDNGQRPIQTTYTSYVTQDVLGSTRVVTGQQQEVKGRHDYLPFGEELSVGTGRGGATQGGSAADSVRQKFTGYELDAETSLNYSQARYYSSGAGRFTSTDPFLASARPTNPQSWNRYIYTINNPVNLIDPSGLDWGYCNFSNGTGNYHYFSDGPVGEYQGHQYTPVDFGWHGYLDVDSLGGERFRIRNYADEPIIPLSEAIARERALERQDRFLLNLEEWANRPETPILLIQPATIPWMAEGGPLVAAETEAESVIPAATAASEATMATTAASETTSTALATMNDAYDAGYAIRNIGGYDVAGKFGRVGDTFNASIWGMYRTPGSKGLFSFTQALEAEARASGATNLNIVGTHIMNPTFTSAVNSGRAARFGFTFGLVNEETVTFSKCLGP